MAQLIPETQAKAEQLLEERDAALGHIGNQLGPDVPIRYFKKFKLIFKLIN